MSEQQKADSELIEPDPTRTCSQCGTSWTAEVDDCPNGPHGCVGPCNHQDSGECATRPLALQRQSPWTGDVSESRSSTGESVATGTYADTGNRRAHTAIRVPMDYEVDPATGLNRGRAHADIEVHIDPTLDVLGRGNVPAFGPTSITLREHNDQVLLHELLHLILGTPGATEADPHGHRTISRVEVALWEAGYRRVEVPHTIVRIEGNRHFCVCGAWLWDGDLPEHIAHMAKTEQPTSEAGKRLATYAILGHMSGIRPACPTCEGPTRETVDMACPTCGFDYGGDPTIDCGCPDAAYDLHVESGCAWEVACTHEWVLRPESDTHVCEICGEER